MKRIIALLITIIMVLSLLGACARSENPEELEGTDSIQMDESDSVQNPTGLEDVSDDAVNAEMDAQFVWADIMISEVMPDNRNLLLGNELDWIELYNPGDMDMSLNGYYLTDDVQKPKAYSLNGLRIRAGEYLVVTLKDDASFHLSEMGETVFLMGNGETISQLSYGAVTNAESFCAEGACELPTPGFANTETGYEAYMNAAERSDLIINEVLQKNTHTYASNGMYYDLVELHNCSNHSVNLSEYYLANSWESTKRFVFPDISLEPGGFFVVYCSGDSALGTDHAPFKLSEEGQTLYLAHKGVFVDALAIPGNLKPDESFGRSGNVPVYLNAATFGFENSGGYLGGVEAPRVSVIPGVYEKAIHVELMGEGTIYYTLDGSRPTTKSKKYSGSIEIDGVETIRAICVNEGRTSSVGNFTYVIGEQHELPILVVSLPEASRDLLLEKVESSQEHEAIATLFENGNEKFTIPFGIRLHGNDSRKGKKKNFQMRFRSEYGASKLEYRLFADRDIDEFNSLLIKGGSEDWGNAMVRDELSTMLANGTSALYTQAMKPVVMYLGGEYWGVHYIRERFSADYVASHLGVSPESVDILYSNKGYVQVGSDKDFASLKNYCKKHEMSESQNYQYLAERIDVNSLVDWYIFRTYVTDNDFANIRRFRSSEADGKWHWMYFDLDWSYYYTGAKPVTRALDDYGGDALLIDAVLQSEEGQHLFLSRYAYMLNTVLNEEYVSQCLDGILEMIESEMPRDRERWGKSMSGWEDHIKYIRKYIRDDTLHKSILNDLKSRFDLTKEEMEFYFGDLYTNR